ncbi:MAG: baseplate J/gp47 family protein [Chloroflexota bacterium]
MKTQIITLETHDDLISVRDKLSWAKTPRILLVWPKYEKVSLRLLDLKVLQRHADSLGARLGLVTRRANVRRDAESLGIPVFRSTKDAQRELWPYAPAPRRDRHVPQTLRRDLRKVRDLFYPKEAAWRTSLAGRVITFTVGVLAVIAVAGIFVPRAAVTLYPESHVQEVVIPVTAGESISSVSLTGSIPAYTISVVIDGEQSMMVSSQISVPKSKASGFTHFTNLSQSEVTVPAGTVVIASGAGGEAGPRFVTLQDIHIRAGPGEVVQTPIEAVVAGPGGNVDAGAITILEGPLGLTLSITNPEPTSGGTTSKETGPTENDRARLRRLMLENLQHEAESQMRATLANGDLLLMDSFAVSQVIDGTYSPLEGQPGRQLVLTMQVEFTANYVAAEDLSQLTRATLDSAVPADFVALAELEFGPVDEPSTDTDGITHFELKATRTIFRKLDVPQVFALTRGLQLEQAMDELSETFSLRKPSEIKLTPSWWPWMPLIPFNVSVEVK